MKLHNFSLDFRLLPAVPISPFAIFCFLFFNFPFNHNAKGGCGQPGSFEREQREWQLCLGCLALTWGSDFSAYLVSDYYFMLCEFENTRRAQQRKAAKSRKRISRVTRLKVCSKIFSFIAACQVCCVRVHGAMRVCLCVCVRRCVLLFHLCNLLPRFVSFRFVWFGFVLVFVFMLLFFRLPSLRHSSIIHIDFFCFSPLPTPLSSALLMFLVFRCPKMFLLIFLYIFCVLCYLLFVGFACDSHVNN